MYLTADDVLEIYAGIIGTTASQATGLLRSRDALEGAVGRPAVYSHYEQADFALQAAVLAHGIPETQPFVDGNKRAALVSMLTFIEANGYRMEAAVRARRQTASQTVSEFGKYGLRQTDPTCPIPYRQGPSSPRSIFKTGRAGLGAGSKRARRADPRGA